MADNKPGAWARTHARIQKTELERIIEVRNKLYDLYKIVPAQDLVSLDHVEEVLDALEKGMEALDGGRKLENLVDAIRDEQGD